MPAMSFWWRSSGCRWRGWSIAAAKLLERGRGPGFGAERPHHLVLGHRVGSPAASPRPAAWSRTRAGAARARPRAAPAPARRGLWARPACRRRRSRPADIRWISSARSPNSTTGILPTRRTPVSSRPTSASSGGSNVFITFIPGASADSTAAPERLLLSLRATISTSGSSGMRVSEGCQRVDFVHVHSTGFRPRRRASEHPGKEGLGPCRSSRRSNEPYRYSTSRPRRSLLSARRSARSPHSATPSSSPTTTRCRRSRTSPTSSGDSLALSRQAAATDAEVIAFCGVHFMAETASILSPEKTVLIPDLDAGCSLADSIDADQLRAWKARAPATRWW